jgi:transcriptional regulator with XRE-family HTH domain
MGLLKIRAADARDELKAFLRARRAELSPETVGLPRGSRRLTPGLRREEVAQLAGVGLTWYPWLEQGRNIRVSTEVLDHIATALRLSHSDKAYLFALAGHSPPVTNASQPIIGEPIELALASIETSPAIIVNPRFDMLATNGLADSVFEPGSYEGPFSENMFWRAYMDPVRRTLYVDWTERLTHSLGLLRANYASRIGDPHFEELLYALQNASDEFREMWGDCRTVSLSPARTRLGPRRLGLLNVWSTRFIIPERPGFLMLVYVPADDETAGIFEREASRLREEQTSTRHAPREL